VSDYARLHGWAYGIVQGVGFRYFVQRKATDYGLTGWVRNLPDESVEFLAEGAKGVLEDFLKEVRIGPSGGHVTDLRFQWAKYQGEFDNFGIRL